MGGTVIQGGCGGNSHTGRVWGGHSHTGRVWGDTVIQGGCGGGAQSYRGGLGDTVSKTPPLNQSSSLDAAITNCLLIRVDFKEDQDVNVYVICVPLMLLGPNSFMYLIVVSLTWKEDLS